MSGAISVEDNQQFDDLSPAGHHSSQLFFFQNQTVSSILNKHMPPERKDSSSPGRVGGTKLEQDIRELIESKEEYRSELKEAPALIANAKGAVPKLDSSFYNGQFQVKVPDKKPPKGGVRTPRPAFSPPPIRNFKSTETSPREIVYVKSSSICKQRLLPAEIKRGVEEEQEKRSFVKFMNRIEQQRPLRQRISSIDEHFFTESFRTTKRLKLTSQEVVDNPETIVSPQYVSSPKKSPTHVGPSIIPPLQLQMQNTPGNHIFFQNKQRKSIYKERKRATPEFSSHRITQKEIDRFLAVNVSEEKREEEQLQIAQRHELPQLLQTQQLFYGGERQDSLERRQNKRRSFTPIPHQKKNSLDLARMNETRNVIPHWFRKTRYLEERRDSKEELNETSEMQKLLEQVFERRKPSGVRPIGVFRRHFSTQRYVQKSSVKLDGQTPQLSKKGLEQSLAALEKKRKESWSRNPRSLSPPLTMAPFHKYTDLQRPFINKTEFKKLSEELKTNIERMGLLSKPAQITAKVPTVMKEIGRPGQSPKKKGKQRRMADLDDDQDEDFMPEPWEESLPRDRGFSYFHEGATSPSRTPDLVHRKSSRMKGKLSVDGHSSPRRKNK